MTKGVTYKLKCVFCGIKFNYIVYNGKDPRRNQKTIEAVSQTTKAHRAALKPS